MSLDLARIASPLQGLAEKARGLTGWRRAGLAFLAGVCGALSMAPIYALPLLVVAFTILIVLIDGAAALSVNKRRRAFAAGWWFGFGYFLAGVYWMAFSFFVQADQFAWMAPFAMMIVPAGLALFPACASVLTAILWRQGWARIFMFSALFALFEYLRGHVLTGLPWNLAGQSLAGSAMGAQTAAYYGAYGLSLVAVLLASAPAAGLRENASVRQTLAGCAVSFVGVAVLFALGAVRLIDSDKVVAADAYVRIVQPNINQIDKIDPNKWGDNFYKALEHSKGPAPDNAPLYIVWPENAAPLLAEARSALDILDTELPPKAVLISGAVRREQNKDGLDDYFNSVVVFAPDDDDRRVTASYDKHHLVPFGEYLPLYDVLNALGLAQLTPYGDAGFAAGAGPQVIEAGGTAFAPLICYEAIFPRELYPAQQRPRWLVTVTNDAWFGDTSGPRQHLDQARLRSIESGLPMARSANTGISALIDAKGRIVERVSLYQGGRIDSALPPALARPPYDRFGDIFFFVMLALCFAAGLGRNQFSRAK